MSGPPRKKTPRDYKFIKLLGEGSFSLVYLAVDATISSKCLTTKKDKKSQKITKFAIKVCQKSHIKRQRKQAAIMREKEIMNVLNNNPNDHFIKLHCTFQDNERLYFVMSYAERGELLSYMLENPLDLHSVRKYTLQLVEALEHLHRLGIIHRDLKPENILLDEKMNIKITDFGSAQIYLETIDATLKPISKTSQPAQLTDRRHSFVGTAQYVSPEMLNSKQATHKSDLWALGIIIYQMTTNVMPFNAPNEFHIYQKILSLNYSFPDDFDRDARSLISALIKLDPDERLGSMDNISRDGYKSIREHDFLSPIARDATDEMTDREIEIEDENEPYPGDEGDAISRIVCGCSNQGHAPYLKDQDLKNIDEIKPGLDEPELLRLLTSG